MLVGGSSDEFYSTENSHSPRATRRISEHATQRPWSKTPRLTAYMSDQDPLTPRHTKVSPREFSSIFNQPTHLLSTMVFLKVQKTSAYHSRYQTPFRRRREAKTDYYARKRLVTQHKAKYASPKYRLVVRITKKDITAQIVSSQINGDVIFTAAYSHELPNYGIKHGLTNWSAAYAVGLLIARRALNKLGLEDSYTGDEDASGEFSLVEAVEDGPRPFKVFLDVGLARTTTGARIFAVAKGASDGGLYVPHSAKRFPGYDFESGDLDDEVLRKYIVGGHVAEYMEELADDDEERYRQLFKSYIEDDIEPDAIEELYEAAHAKIREDPVYKKKAGKTKEEYKAISLKFRKQKLTREERAAKIAEKIAAFRADN